MTMPVLRARTSTALEPAAPRVGLSERMAEAKALSRAGDLIPRAYRNNEGACLLAMDWAESHGVSLFDTMGHVAFFGGKATIEARLQRAMAARAGYFTKVTAEGADPGHEFCTVGVYDSAGGLLGEYTMTHSKAMLLDNYTSNQNYKKSLDQMLLARATTRALDRYATAPTLMGVFVDEEDDTSDPVAIIRAVSDVEPDATYMSDVKGEVIEDAVIVEAEILEEDAPAADIMGFSAWTSDTLKQALRNAGITQSQALQATSCSTITDLASKPDLVDKVLFPEVEQPAQSTLLPSEEPF